MSLGEKIKSLRQKAKRTMQAESELNGVKLNTIFRWEHDLAIPKQAEMEKIAELHGVTVEWLTQDNEARDDLELESIDQQLFSMVTKLSNNQKYKILGYIERVYIEGQHGTV